MSISNGMSFSLLVSGFLKFSSEAAIMVFLLCVAHSEWGPVCWGTGSPGRGMGSRVSPILFPVTIPGPRWHFYPAESPTPKRKPRVVPECWMVAMVLWHSWPRGFLTDHSHRHSCFHPPRTPSPWSCSAQPCSSWDAG